MLRFADSEKFISNPGDPIRILYSEKVNKDGSIDLVEVGKENINDLIQANKDSTDIAAIVAYYNQTGDESVLNRMVPSYGDYTKVPNSFAEMLQLRLDSLSFFDALPTEVKLKFDNDPNRFFATGGSDEWFDIMKPIIDQYGSSRSDDGVEKGDVSDGT